MLTIVTGDITTMAADAIVCPAHKHLLPGRGLSAQIYEKAGEQLLTECRQLGECHIGEAILTKAYKLPADYIIHTVTPQWSSGDFWGSQALKQLQQCYESVIQIAKSKNLASIVFPALGAGANNTPHSLAAHIALDVLMQYKDQFEQLTACLHSEADRQVWLETQQMFYKTQDNLPPSN